MRRKYLKRGLLAGFLVASTGISSTLSSSSSTAKDINRILEPIRQRHNLPALAAAVVLDGKTVASGAVGVRKFDTDVKVTIDDKFHLGSCGKSMTATMIAAVVEKGKLNWTTTLAEFFPELANEMLPKYRDVTLLHLLSHRASLQTAWPENGPVTSWYGRNDTIQEQRYLLMKMQISSPANANMFEIGRRFIYSNSGYVTATAMAERAMGESWEQLTTRFVFNPLGITSAGFGPMGTGELIDQPWQHRSFGGNIIAVSPLAPFSDNPPVLRPAGCIHMTVGDWAKYIAAHVEGHQGRSTLLKHESFEKLHTAPFKPFTLPLGREVIDSYALGWGLEKADWATGIIITHGGSNNQNYAETWLAPDHHFAVLVATNFGTPDQPTAHDAMVEVRNAMVNEFLPREGK